MSTQYPIMSGSTRVISSVKGGVQVRVMVGEHNSTVAFSEPTAERVPVKTDHECHV
jgi:hypothetical protein